MFKQFKTINTDSRDLNIVQDNISNAVSSLPGNEILNGRIEKGVVLLAAKNPNVISHKLDRIPNGYIVIKRSADSRVWDSQSTNTIQDKTLNLKCSADVTVDLWIF